MDILELVVERLNADQLTRPSNVAMKAAADYLEAMVVAKSLKHQ
jgi:hypothetical protein